MIYNWLVKATEAKVNFLLSLWRKPMNCNTCGHNCHCDTSCKDCSCEQCTCDKGE